MQTFIQLIHQLNVGKKHRITMDALKAHLAGLPLKHLSTYLQSGNLIFNSDLSTEAINHKILQRLREETGFELVAQTHASQHWDSHTLKHPAWDEFHLDPATVDGKQLHFFFLTHAPEEAWRERAEAKRAPTERYCLAGQTLCFHAPEGLGRSKLGSAWPRVLDCDLTARNWRTVAALSKRAAEIKNQPN